MINIRIAEADELDDAKHFILRIFPNALVYLNGDDIVLLAEYQGQKVGFAHMADDGKHMILKGIGVEHSMRGRGVGSLLMDRIMEVVSEIERPVFLKVKAMNPAIDFYSRYGFFLKKFGRTHVLVKKPNN